MTELCRALFKYENERKIGWYNRLTTLWFTKSLWRVEKGDLLGWTLSMTPPIPISNVVPNRFMIIVSGVILLILQTNAPKRNQTVIVESGPVRFPSSYPMLLLSWITSPSPYPKQLESTRYTPRAVPILILMSRTSAAPTQNNFPMISRGPRETSIVGPMVIPTSRPSAALTHYTSSAP